jgi:hypothetical protein
MWVKKDNYTYQSIQHNLYYNAESKQWEVWITRPTGKSKLVFEGDEAKANVVFDAMNYAVKNSITLVEL